VFIIRFIYNIFNIKHECSWKYIHSCGGGLASDDCLYRCRKCGKYEYGFDMPEKARYKRFTNRIYTIMDFKDGEEILFFCNCEKPNACALGNAFYINTEGYSKLVNIKELKPIKE
jgi:hypothetical protein